MRARAISMVLAAASLALTGAVFSGPQISARASGSTPNPGPAIAWGSNSSGTLGNGSTTGSTIPVAVSLPAGVVVTAIAGGDRHSLALTSDGHVLAWGDNFWGQLGGPSVAGGTLPTAVNLPSTVTVTAIAAGGSHSLALSSTGQVWAWGENQNGELGNGTTTSSNTPARVNLASGVTVSAIASGFRHSLALTSTGAVLAWGYNASGQLGTGTTTDSWTPTGVSLGSGTTASAISAGDNHSLALTSNGQVLAWGQNYYGQLGNASTTDSSTPVSVRLPSGTTITAVAGGGLHSLAVTSTGGVLDWGANIYGQLGNGTTANSSAPIQVALPIGTSVTAVAGGGSHSLAITSTGQALAWGYNADGQLGNGTTTTTGCYCAPIPGRVSLPTDTTVTAIAAGGLYSLAIQPLPAVAVLPAMTNGAYGGYVTATTIQNTGTAAAYVRIGYFNQNGAPVGSGDTITSLPVNASWTVRQDNGNSFPGSGGNTVQAGSAVIYSSQPVAAFVNEFPPGSAGDATSYTGIQVPTGVGTTLYAPTIVNNAYGGYTTGIGLLNQGSSATDVTITYRDGSGGVIKTQTVNALAAHAYQGLYSGDGALALPSGFAGTATITSSAGQPLGAIVNETGPGGQFSSYDAVPSGAIMLNVPVALNNAYGGYYTGMGIQNLSGTGGTVFVTYYDASGTATPSKIFSIAAFGSLGVYQGSPTDGPPAGPYTAVIQSFGGLPLAAIVNEVAPAGAGSARQSTSYNTFAAGTATLHLPLVENGGSDPWNTGEGIMNTGSSTTTVTVSYFDPVTGAPIGTPPSQSLAPHAFWGVYQPTAGLSSGTRATAVVTTSSGGQVAVICNESSPTTFMSYGGQ